MGAWVAGTIVEGPVPVMPEEDWGGERLGGGPVVLVVLAAALAAAFACLLSAKVPQPLESSMDSGGESAFSWVASPSVKDGEEASGCQTSLREWEIAVPSLLVSSISLGSWARADSRDPIGAGVFGECRYVCQKVVT